VSEKNVIHPTNRVTKDVMYNITPLQKFNLKTFFEVFLKAKGKSSRRKLCV